MEKDKIIIVELNNTTQKLEKRINFILEEKKQIIYILFQVGDLEIHVLLILRIAYL